MKQPGKNRSNHVFKRFFRSRVSDSTLRTAPSSQTTPFSTTNSRTRTQSNLALFRNVETGEADIKQIRCGPCNIFVVWDSPFSLKLLGSRSAIEKEEMRRRNLSYFIIHPCCRFRIYWDSVLLIFLMLNVILLPVAIAFYYEPDHPGWLTFNIFSDAVFLTDVFLNFWTGIITEDNEIILDIRKLRRNYAKKWLIIDLLSLLPFDYATYFLFSLSAASASLVQGAQTLRLIRPLTKLLSLLKLLRLAKFLHSLSKWEETMSSSWSIRHILNFMFGMILLCHWNGCIQFLIAYLENFPPNSWVALNNLQNAAVGTQYGWALYKAMSHMLCIGYGQRPPRTTVEVWVTIVSMLLGATLYAMFIGHITNLIYSTTSSTRLYNEKLKLVEEYMRYHKIPKQLKIKVRNYFYHRYHGRLFNEKTMLKELSHVLEEEITKFNYRDVLQMVPMFKDADEDFLSAIVSMFSYEVFLEGDMIISNHSRGNTMYFIQHGEAQILNCNGEVVRVLVDGEYFGEIGLLMNERRQGSVRATTVCFVFCLSREDLNTVLNQFPTLRASLEARARERLQELYLSEKRPLESILALFSDPELDTPSAASESTDSEISDILKAGEVAYDTYLTDSGTNTNPIASTYNSSILNALPQLKTPSPESCHSITTPSTCTGTLTAHYQLPPDMPHN